MAARPAVGGVARVEGIPVAMDGARIFNAPTPRGVGGGELAATADTVTFCVSKVLSAPVGSVLCGPAGVIDRARRWRKAVGGGWREAGGPARAGPGGGATVWRGV